MPVFLDMKLPPVPDIKSPGKLDMKIPTFKILDIDFLHRKLAAFFLVTRRL